MRKGNFFCSCELFLGGSYIMKEYKVSVRDEGGGCQTGQLKKMKLKTPKISLQQDSVTQKG